MSKAKVARKSTRIDMTAMSDVTVLLLTFFMLTSTFVKKEPVQVNTPGSVSEVKIPETNILSILIDTEGKVFMSFDKQEDMIKTLIAVSKEFPEAYQYNVEIDTETGKLTGDPEDVKLLTKFKILPTFGADIRQMKEFLAMKSEDQDRVLPTLGIPTDSVSGVKYANGSVKTQFELWVEKANAGKSTDDKLRIAIKADQKTSYAVIKTVMNSLQTLKENRYNLITSLKQANDDKQSH
ncbi:MAG: biopolymer transporter ExbD [Prevotellaceae bacterium]|jgi:biopolymer transport protein ExbD|nr:biopolymer transporter ExbD [Prevotellaceae bacterium]